MRYSVAIGMCILYTGVGGIPVCSYSVVLFQYCEGIYLHLIKTRYRNAG